MNLYNIGLILLTTLINVFISFATASLIMVLCLDFSISKNLTLFLSIVGAAAAMIYIRFNHILFTKSKGEVNGE